MPDQDLRDIDKTKKQSSEGMAVSSYTGSLFSSNPLSTTSNNPPRIGPTPDPNRSVHCEFCGMQSYFVGGLHHEHHEIQSSLVPAPETLDDDRPSPRFTSFCG